MAFQPLSVGDILMLSQTAWKIGRAFTQGKKGAPVEFTEVERESNGLSEALKLVAETLHEDGSLLSQADEETRHAVNTILYSARKTLDDLDSFVERYQVIKKKETNGGFVVERSWSDVVVANYKTFKWTTEGGDINDLRNMLQMHSNSINLTMQALQSRSLARLEKTVVPMAEKVASIHDRVHGDLGLKIDDLHHIILSIANSTPSLVARDRSIEAGTLRDSISTTSTLDRAPMNYYTEDHNSRDVSSSSSSHNNNDRLLEARPPPRTSSYLPPRNRPPRPSTSSTKFAVVSTNSPNTAGAVAARQARSSSREDSAYYSSGRSSYLDDTKPRMDWHFETGSPTERRSSIGGYIDPDHDSAASYSAHPKDSAYAPVEPEYRHEPDYRREPAIRKEPRQPSERPSQKFRRESATLGNFANDFENDIDEQEDDAVAGSSRTGESWSPKSKMRSWRSSTTTGLLPPPAMSSDDEQSKLPATPASIFSRTKSMPIPIDPPSSNRPQTAKSVKSLKRASQPHTPSYTEGTQFHRQLFRNAAILCDVRGRLVEHAQVNPNEPDPRYNVEMVPACEEARICVVRKRENKDLGGTKVVTSVWCLSDDGEIRLQQKLSEMQETVPYCSYFDPEKVSLQSSDAPITLRFHGEVWGGMLKEEIKTNWVNYYFASENDAVAFQSAVFGRMLIGSFRTTKTTVIHEGLKGAFAFEEQFANIEMLRLWEDDGVATAGAQGGVMALMHISSNFGEGWARWWINCSKQTVKVKEDGMKHAKVKGIDITVVRPPKVPSVPADGQVVIAPRVSAAVKRVHGVRIEFRTEEERSEFVSAAKKAQERPRPLPDL